MEALFRKRVAALAPLALACAAQPGLAHHSQAPFNLAQPIIIEGVVREFQYTNPHCYIQMTVRNERGQDEEWSVEMGAPTHLAGRGWKRNTLKPGDEVRVTISPLRDGRRGGELVSITRADGKPLLPA